MFKQIFIHQAREKEINLKVEKESTFDDDLADYAVNLDKSKFTQVIRNLMSNALKFSPKGSTITVALKLISTSPASTKGTRIFPESNVTDTTNYNYVQLSVADQGVGISKVSSKIYMLKY
jgi:signal transduction histidine kinase